MNGGEHVDREKLRIGQERDDYARALDRALEREFNPDGGDIGFTTYYDNIGPESPTFITYATTRSGHRPVLDKYALFVRGFHAGWQAAKVDG